jgi:hypothetical protein
VAEQHARRVVFCDRSLVTDRQAGPPVTVPTQVLIDGDDVTEHVLPGLHTYAPLRRTGHRVLIAPWAVNGFVPQAEGAVVVELAVRPAAVEISDDGRRIVFAGHLLLTPAHPHAVVDLGDVEMPPGYRGRPVGVQTNAGPWREPAVLLRMFAETVEFRPAGPSQP